MGQTDGQRDVRIAESLNAPLTAGQHNKYIRRQHLRGSGRPSHRLLTVQRWGKNSHIIFVEPAARGLSERRRVFYANEFNVDTRDECTLFMQFRRYFAAIFAAVCAPRGRCYNSRVLDGDSRIV